MDEEIKNVQNEDGINEETAEETTANAEVEEEPIGNIKISVDVVSTIAGIATTEIDGVAGMYGTFAGGIAEMFGAKKNPSKGVKVDMNETTATIDLYIVVDYGVRIPELSWEIQENVKNSVETMTGLDVQKVNIHIEGVSFEKEKEEKANRSMQLVENITNFYPDSVDKEYPNMACGSWIATENGIFSSETSKARELVCHHPIMPIRRLKNIETGEEQITVAFKRDGYWTEITVPKIDIVTSRAITNLARFGVQVNSENARLLVKYLADVEMYNADMIDIQHSTSKLGWHGNVFVPYDLSIVFDGEYRFKTLFQSIQESGDYFKWVTLAKQLRSCGRLEPRIALAASFASVLIQPLDVLPFIVDFYGQTGGGKTVTINIAASVWGNPAPGASRAGRGSGPRDRRSSCGRPPRG